MGLTIHYSLSLPHARTSDEAVSRMEALRRFVVSLPSVTVSPFVHLSRTAIRQILDRKSQPELLWAMIQSERSIGIQYGFNGRVRPAAEDRRATVFVRIPPIESLGFTVDLGDGCEPLELFVSNYPTSTLVAREEPLPGEDRPIKDPIAVPPPWLWCGRAFCKTQYASIPALGGVANFLRCHLSVIATLDAANDLGFAVEVQDEGGYHDQRNVPALVSSIGSWNHLITEFTGSLRQQFRDAVVPAVTNEELSSVAEHHRATAMADQVLDLIRLTRGSTTAGEPSRG